jgi:hypothetical protein
MEAYHRATALQIARKINEGLFGGRKRDFSAPTSGIADLTYLN